MQTQKNQTTRRKKRTKDGVGGIHGDLILSSITNQTLRISESDIRWRGSVTLIISNDLNTVVLPYSNTRVGRAEIDTDRRTFAFTGHCCAHYLERERGKDEREN